MSVGSDRMEISHPTTSPPPSDPLLPSFVVSWLPCANKVAVVLPIEVTTPLSLTRVTRQTDAGTSTYVDVDVVSSTGAWPVRGMVTRLSDDETITIAPGGWVTVGLIVTMGKIWNVTGNVTILPERIDNVCNHNVKFAYGAYRSEPS